MIIKDDQIYLYDDDRFPIDETCTVKYENVRFRTLGCYPLTAGITSNAKSVKDIIKEIENSNYSERSGRLIDYDTIGSMELKKREGYF